MDADDASITAEEEGGEEDTGADADNEDEEEDEPDIGEIDAVEEIVDEKESKAAAEYAERYFDNVDDDSQDDAIGIFDTHQPVDLAHDAEQSQEPQVNQPLSAFDIALGLMTHIRGMSNANWTIIREILRLPKSPGDSRVPLKNLPKALATTKASVTRQLPLIDMRVMDVLLKIEKLPTMNETQKEKAKQNEVLTAKLFFFNPVSLFTSILVSDLAKKMHFDMAYFVDSPSELYHSHTWSGSIRTTSGIYVHSINEDLTLGDPIFPSNFVYFVCCQADCRCANSNASDYSFYHVGRVYGVGKDFKSRSLRNKAAPHRDNIHYIPQKFTIDFCPITRDLFHGKAIDDPSYMPPETQCGKLKAPHQKYTPKRPKMKDQHNDFLVRRIILDNLEVDPLCHTHPIRAELELEYYSRKIFTEK
ncbi:hypothetical protein COL516b_005887 [Colletotrichum fioriniae]|nr:uncharacterized protein COL516b_005887 [Colletotrichum fioriniae]KAJ0304530.1 hypothetical protein COL516b_005887 [Colletotrichum fioriniae]